MICLAQCVATQLYKDRLIVSEGTIDGVTGRWRVMVDITARVDRQSRVLKVPSQEFENKEEAETFGVTFAQNWINEER